MTAAEILALAAGPELDALVTEKVMGWTWKLADPWPPPEYLHRRTDRWVTPDGRCYGTARGRNESGEQYPPLPSFSCDIDAFWQVVEVLSARGFMLVLEDWRFTDQAPAAWAALFHDRQGHDTGHAPADTAPLAICRAALLACALHPAPRVLH